jgi:hypothetical protein
MPYPLINLIIQVVYGLDLPVGVFFELRLRCLRRRQLPVSLLSREHLPPFLDLGVCAQLFVVAAVYLAGLFLGGAFVGVPVALVLEVLFALFGFVQGG